MFESFINYIAHTNLFNFIVFAAIIGYILVKIDFLGMLDKGKNSVAENIEVSVEKKEQSEKNLQTIEEKLANISEEISNIINNSKENAKHVGEKIIADANLSADNIKNNSLKLVENKSEILKNDIIKRVSLASVEVAKNQIIQELSVNSDLHKKLIDESVEAIDEVEL